MDPTPKRRWSKRWKLAAACALGLAIYCGSFYAVRRGNNVTFLVGEQSRFYTILVFHFAKNRQLNFAAWLFYYPLHRQSSDSLCILENALMRPDGGDEMAREHLRLFYVSDVDVLARAGLRDFRVPNSLSGQLP